MTRCAAFLLLALVAARSPGAEEGVPALPELMTPEAAAAIERGVSFLARSQRADGAWDSEGGFGSYPMAMTSLAGMALLAHGSTPTKGPEAENVRRAVEWILRNQGPTGLYASLQENREMRSMYGHGFAMLFLAQVYGLEGDTELARRIQRSLAQAVQLSTRAQSMRGGWNYNPDARADEGSVTVTQVHALRAVANVGIRVPKQVLDNAVAYVEGSQNEDGGISYQRGQRGSRPAISAAGLTCLLYAGRYDGRATQRVLDFCMATFVRGGRGGNLQASVQAAGHYFYTQYYLAQGMWLAGDRYWREYFPAARDDLVRMQQGDGGWRGEGGVVYGTSLSLIVLELPFRYLPIYQR